MAKGAARQGLLRGLAGAPAIGLSRAQQRVLVNLAEGAFSPLEGFMGSGQLEAVARDMRLPSDLPWTLPVLLDVARARVRGLKAGDEVALTDERGARLGRLAIEEVFRPNWRRLARAVFGTADGRHPGVAAWRARQPVCLAGKVDLARSPRLPFAKLRLTPAETRVLFAARGWRTVVAFQTRNPPHLGHEYVQKTALTFVDGLFVNPVVGEKKRGDFTDELIVRAYRALLKEYYLRDRSVMAVLPLDMWYAGPREAVHHAIVRKNFGCTHFIVGRDHAGAGAFYGPYDAQAIFEKFPDLGIVPLMFREFFFCARCGAIANEKTCPHGASHRTPFSGTAIRKALAAGRPPPAGLMRPEVARVVLQARRRWVA